MTPLPPVPNFRSAPSIERKGETTDFTHSSHRLDGTVQMRASNEAPKRLGISAYSPAAAGEEKLIIWLFKRKAEEYQRLNGKQGELKIAKIHQSQEPPLQSNDNFVARDALQTSLVKEIAPENSLSAGPPLPTLTLPAAEPILKAQRTTSFSIPFLTSFST